VTGFTFIHCRRREQAKRCSTANCNANAFRLCDAPIKRAWSGMPKAGDAGWHQERHVLYYVHSVRKSETGVGLRVSTKPPGLGKPKLQEVALSKWIDTVWRTCSRPICDRCTRQVDGHDFCPAHERLSVKSIEPPKGTT
jgi:hypothetical protein